MEGKTEVIIQTKVCDSAQLDCVAKLEVEPGECIERCEGSIVEVQRLNTVRNTDGLADFLSSFEKYKNPDHSNLTYPNTMKGNHK